MKNVLVAVAVQSQYIPWLAFIVKWLICSNSSSISKKKKKKTECMSKISFLTSDASSRVI